MTITTKSRVVIPREMYFCLANFFLPCFSVFHLLSHSHLFFSPIFYYLARDESAHCAFNDRYDCFVLPFLFFSLSLSSFREQNVHCGKIRFLA